MLKDMYYLLPSFLTALHHHHATKDNKCPAEKERWSLVHACAHFALGERTAKEYYGNKRWNSYYLRGVVVSSTDG